MSKISYLLTGFVLGSIAIIYSNKIKEKMCCVKDKMDDFYDSFVSDEGDEDEYYQSTNDLKRGYKKKRRNKQD